MLGLSNIGGDYTGSFLVVNIFLAATKKYFDWQTACTGKQSVRERGERERKPWQENIFGRMTIRLLLQIERKRSVKQGDVETIYYGYGKKCQYCDVVTG